MSNERRKITLEEFRAQLIAQGVSSEKHAAFKCPICGTVQSMATLALAGVAEADCEKYIAFSCEGRFTGAGPWTQGKKKQVQRAQRGCDWTLGGLFQLHTLEVVTPDGKIHPRFEFASPEEAQVLEAWATKLLNGGNGIDSFAVDAKETTN
jgi:hypothetical protein